MINRVDFFDSIEGIKYPGMIVDFFDQFIAIKQLVEGTGAVRVEDNTERSITFIVNFTSKEVLDSVLSNISYPVIVYGRPISVKIENISELELRFILQ